MRRTTAVLALAGLMGLAGAASADETTFCNTFITAVPFTISVQGHYCFDRNLAFSGTAGNAITINSDFVVVDLNNFKLGGGSAGLGTNAIGIASANHRNITIRNGNIRGFKKGISITGSGGGHVIENNVLDGNTYYGAEVFGDTMVVRNNIVTNTGGSTVNTSYPYGIKTGSTGNYGFAVVRDNVVTNTFNPTANGAYGIGVYNLLADHNLVRMGPVFSGGSYGIGWFTATVYCRDNTVLNASDASRAMECTKIGPVGSNYSNP